MTPADETVFRKQYRKSVEDIRSLKSRLPEDSIASLAREVLLRVANHALNFGGDVPDDEIEALAHALISPDQDAAAEIVRGLRDAGTTRREVSLSYLSKASRVLGTWWEEDKISFLDVTAGTGRIYAILRSMSGLMSGSVDLGRKSAVLSAVPDETHTLGVRMAADLLRQQGWEIDLKIGLDHHALVEEIAAGDYAIIGLSGGGIHAVGDMARLVVALRISCPNAKVLVSGNIVNEARELVELMDVDAMPDNYQDAEAEMERLWRDYRARAR